MTKGSSYYTYVDTWKKSVQVSEHSIRLFVMEDARAALEMNGSWDHQAQDDGGAYLFRISTRSIFQTRRIYERKLHLALRQEHGVAHLFIEEGDRLIICEATADQLCIALGDFLA